MGKRKSKNQDRKKKLNLVFDEDKRKDFLCGFRKRKLERKKKAQEELKLKLKEEKKRIKLENKEAYKKLVVSYRPIPDIEQLLQEEYEDEDVNVKIVEVSSDTLKKKDLCIGDNIPKEILKTKKMDKDIVKESDVVPGMGLEIEAENENSDKEDNSESTNGKTKKEIKRLLKKQATKKIQKSKAFQIKSKLDSIKNRKKSLHKQHAQSKFKKNHKKERPNKNFGKRKH